MAHIHTIIFELGHVQLPIARELLPTSARLLNIMCEPERYGWAPSTDNKDGIVIINMKGMGIEVATILNFIRTIRNNEIRSTPSEIQKMEHFTILIGANQDTNCPFYNIIEKFYTAKKNEKKKQEEDQKNITSNPKTPQEDIHQLYQWSVHGTIGARSLLPLDEWDVCAPASVRGDGAVLDWFYRKKRENGSD